MTLLLHLSKHGGKHVLPKIVHTQQPVDPNHQLTVAAWSINRFCKFGLVLKQQERKQTGIHKKRLFCTSDMSCEVDNLYVAGKCQAGARDSYCHSQGHIKGSRPEWCISTKYHAWDTPFWSGTFHMQGTRVHIIPENSFVTISIPV